MYAIKRRTFLQVLFTTPLAALWRPRTVQAQQPGYTDSEGATDLSALYDGILANGIEYTP